MEKLIKSLALSRADSLDPAGLVSRSLPEKVLQFGEGGFLRGFVDLVTHNDPPSNRADYIYEIFPQRFQLLKISIE